MYIFRSIFTTCCFLTSSQVFAQDNLCNDREVPVFSCHLGKKIASLCATNDLNETTGALYYRMGSKKNIEMTFPETPAHPSKQFILGGMMYVGGGEYTYTVYSSSGQNGRDNAIPWNREGVTVRKDGKLLSNLLCKDAALSSDGWSKIYAAKLPADDDRSQEP